MRGVDQEWNIRKRPETSSSALRSVRNGAMVEALRVTNGWLELADGLGFTLSRSEGVLAVPCVLAVLNDQVDVDRVGTVLCVV